MATLMRYSPGYPFGSLRREIDRLFDQVNSGNDGDGDGSMVWSPRADFSETEDGYTLRVDVPGLDRENLNIELHEGTLTVSGERRDEREDQNEKFHRIERTYGRFYRSFTLPQAGNTEKVEASMNNGVLTIHVPKREESMPRRIEVK